MDTALTTRAVAGIPRLLLRLEGLALLTGASWVFAQTGQPWWLYAVLFILPDVSFAAYLAGPKPGSMVYNMFHSTLGPACLVLAGLVLDHSVTIGIAAIWAAHVGFDRVLGYGLKYATGFGDTHLGRIGLKSAGT